MTLTRPKLLRELALEYLRDRIADNSLKMGRTLSEGGISEELGVSKSRHTKLWRSYVTRAWSVSNLKKGARVFSLSESEVAQICDFCLAIETAGFELAPERNPKALADDMARVVQEKATARMAGNGGHWRERSEIILCPALPKFARNCERQLRLKTGRKRHYPRAERMGCGADIRYAGLASEVRGIGNIAMGFEPGFATSQHRLFAERRSEPCQPLFARRGHQSNFGCARRGGKTVF